MSNFVSDFFHGNQETRDARVSERKLKAKLLNRGSLHPKEQERMNVVRRKTKMHILKLIGTGIVASTGGAVIVAGLLARKPETPQLSSRSQDEKTVFAPPTQEEFEEHLQLREFHKERTIKALLRFKNVNERTAELFDMLKQHAYYTIPRGSKMTVMHGPPDDIARLMQNPHRFEIVFMPEEYISMMPSSITWEGNENVLRIAANIPSDEWLAAFLYHELFHIQDRHSLREIPGDRQSWTNGEVRAHILECDVLAAWKPNEYARLLADGVPKWQARDLDGVDKLGADLFPVNSLPFHAANLARGALRTCVAFENARQTGRKMTDVYLQELFPANDQLFHKGSFR